jgi:hypothetical protein
VPVVREVLRAPGLYLAAALAVGRAALEVRRQYGRHPFDELIVRLRQRSGDRADGAPGPGGDDVGSAVARAVAQGRVAGRLLRWLPPRRMGPCLKRSLVLLHLWSGAGFAVRVHLGFQPVAGAAPLGHAWLTADRSELVPLCGGPNGSTEVLAL